MVVIEEKVVEVTVEELRPILGQKLRGILDTMTAGDIAKASLSQKAVALGILFDKEQILQGKPTQIIGTEERRELPELTKMLVEEAKRRGIKIESVPPQMAMQKEEPSP